MKYKSYDELVNFLKCLNSTEQVLYVLYEYFRDYVSYNYDMLQSIKLSNRDGRLGEINDLALMLPANNESREKLLSLLDEEFIKLEGRKLTDKNRELFFKNYGRIIHHEATPAKKGIIGGFNRPATPARDEILKGININERGTGLNNYPREYYEDGLLLKKGVCADYAVFINSICSQLGITSYTIKGKGTTGHAWNIIYIPEKQEWIHFDMTMVKFYQDAWIKEHKDFKQEDWIFANTSKIFEMQPSREIHTIQTDEPIYFNSIINSQNFEQFYETLNQLKPNNNLAKK